MINRLPADVPKSGKCYDLTLTGAGLDSRKRELAMFVIDNGDFRGVRVSAYLTAPLREALIESGVPAENFSTRALDAMKYDIRLSVKIVIERLMKSTAGLYKAVDENYNETNVYVVYHLSDFGEPKNDTELAKAFERKEAKFQRKPDGALTDDIDVEEVVSAPPEKPVAPKPKAKATRKRSSTKK